MPDRWLGLGKNRRYYDLEPLHRPAKCRLAGGFTVNSDTEITASGPAHAAGGVDVTVTTPGGTGPADPAVDKFIFAVRTVTGVSPSSGAAAGGTTVTITGSGFTGATGVSFGGTLLAAGGFAVNSDTQITATSPAHSAGGVEVRVTTPGGTSPADPAVDTFTFTAAPPAPRQFHVPPVGRAKRR